VHSGLWQAVRPVDLWVHSLAKLSGNYGSNVRPVNRMAGVGKPAPRWSHGRTRHLTTWPATAIWHSLQRLILGRLAI